MHPFLIADPSKWFEEASAARQVAISAQGFGVMAVHDLGRILRSKGIGFPEECRV